MHSQHFEVTESDHRYGNFTYALGDFFNFHYNSDLSGGIIINHHRPNDNDPRGYISVADVQIPAWMILEFVGRYMQGEAIGAIEEMSGKDFLSGKIRPF